MGLVGAALIVIALTVLPGFATLRALAASTPLLVRLAGSVPVSAGIAYTTAIWLSLVGLDVRWTLLGLGAATGVSLVAAHRAVDRPVRVSKKVRGDLAVCAGAGLVVLGVWATAMGGFNALPPHDDGYNHGYFISRITDLWTLDQSSLNTLDSLTATRSIAFYPMATHLEAGLVTWFTGVGAGPAFTIVALVGVVVALPTGMLALTNAIFPDHPHAGRIAAAVAVCVPALTYAASWSGMFPAMLGLAAVPGVAVLAIAWVRDRSRGSFAGAAIGLVGLFGIHSSAAATCVVFAFVLSFIAPGRLRWSSRLIRGATWVSVSLAAMLPALVDLIGGWAERRAASGQAVVSWPVAIASAAVLRDLLSGPAPVIFTALAWVSLAHLQHRRVGRPWLVLVLVLAVTYPVLFMWRVAPVLLVTSPWYGDPVRISTLLTFTLVPPVAYLAVRLADRAGSTRTQGIAAALIVTAVAGQGLVAGWRMVHRNYADFSVVTASDRKAFDWLQAHTAADERVLNGLADGSQWLYPLTGVALVNPTNAQSGTESADRTWLTGHADFVRDGPRTEALLHGLNVRYALVGERTFPGSDNLLHADALATSGRWHEVYRSGSARVFELVPADGT